MRTRYYFLAAVGLAGAIGTLSCASLATAQTKEEAAKAQAEARQAELDAQAEQYVQYLHPWMWRELEFVRQTCELTPSQRPIIKAAAEKSVKQAARDIVAPRRTSGRGSVVTAHQSIRNDIAKVLKETLTAEQLAQYTLEEKKRSAAMKRATILSVVAQIDSALYLNQDQRDQISQALETNWKDDWEQWLRMWQYAGRYFPQVPDPLVTPYLTDQQKSVWSGLQKVTISFWGGDSERQPVDDEWWEEKPAASQSEPKAKSPPDAVQKAS
jgi:hypothetical protein